MNIRYQNHLFWVYGCDILFLILHSARCGGLAFIARFFARAIHAVTRLFVFEAEFPFPNSAMFPDQVSTVLASHSYLPFLDSLQVFLLLWHRARSHLKITFAKWVEQLMQGS